MPKADTQKLKDAARMVNYSQVYQDTINEFVSPFVPGDQGDAGKGQVNARAGYKICVGMNPNIGYIAKVPGQTQYHGIAVDAIQDSSTGYGADFLTDELQSDGTRLIKVAYTPYPAPATPPNYNWIQPTPDYLSLGGPLTLKVQEPIPPSDGRPEGYPPDAEWPAPMINPTWATSTTEIYSYEWYAQMAGNVENIYLTLLYRWSDFKGAANWLKNIREDKMQPNEMVEAIKASDEYKAIHG